MTFGAPDEASPASLPASAAARRPAISPARAESLGRDSFGWSGAAAELPSERGRNFLLGAPGGERRVLKVTWYEPSRELALLETRVLVRAAAHGLPVPRVSPSRTGGWIEEATDDLGRPCAVRLLDFLEGRHLAEVPKAPAVLGALGAVLARLDALLRDETDPAAERAFAWDLSRAPAEIARRIDAVGDRDRRGLIERLVERCSTEIAPREPLLRRGLIHNDANDYNVLVGPADASDTERFEPSRITALLDFGDLLCSYLVCEPAIAAAYAVLDHRDPLAAIGAVAAGYHRELLLGEPEIETLFPFVLLRLCLSVTMAAHQRAREPDNEYLSVSEAPAWRTLERLERIHPRFAAWSLRAACGLEPVATARRAVACLERARPAPVLARRLDDASTLVLDFGVASPLLAELEDRDDQRAWARVIERRMAEAGAAVGWGRYDEARGWYTTPAFQSADGGEARTVHLGVDLFVPPGTPVHAPLAGRVHSLADNDRPLDYGATLVLEHELDAGDEGGEAEPVRVYTLWGHLTRDSLARHRPGDAVAAGQEIAGVGDFPENGGWAPHLHLQIVLDLLDHEGDFPGVAAPSRRALWLANSPDPNLLLRLPPALLHSGDVTAVREPEDLQRRRAGVLGPSLSLSYDEPLFIVRGEGASLFDHDGRRYVDLVNNVCHVGHAHPRVVRAMATQAALLETNTRYLHEAVLRYAERLAATLPAPLEVCFFVNSGSEANDLALRLAREHTGRRDVVCLEAAYHGNLTSLIDVSPYKHDGPGGSGTPAHVHKAWLPDPYRGRCRGANAAEGYAASVARACEETRRNGGVAAFIAEALPSCGGQIVPPAGYLARAYAAVRAAGGVCIADEVQTGFGRVGTCFWAFETQGVVPDIVTLGKPIGNGHPLGAVVTTRAIAESFARGGMEYFNTFGGNPVSAAVGLAVLDVIEEEGLQRRALELGTRLRNGLLEVQRRFPAVVGDVRGPGLFQGIELVRDPETREPDAALARHLVERLKDRRFLLSTDGPDHDVIKIKPPLAVTAADLDAFVAALAEILATGPASR